MVVPLAYHIIKETYSLSAIFRVCVILDGEDENIVCTRFPLHHPSCIPPPGSGAKERQLSLTD